MTPVEPKATWEGATSVVFAKDQPEYTPLPAQTDGNIVLTEWEPSAEDLAALLNGGRVRLWIWTFGKKLQPTMLETATYE